MKLSFDLKKIITDELRYVANRISDENEVIKKVYVYSAAYAMVYRILNVEFDRELVLMHCVLQTSYTQINNMLNNIMAGSERVITIDARLFEFLAKSLQSLADDISEDRDIKESLTKIAMTGYCTTGNGYYLYEKGILKLVD